MKIKTKAIVFCVVAIIVLVIAQALSQVIGYIFTAIGIPFLEPIIGAVLYPVLTYFGLKITASKMLKEDLSNLRINKPHLKWYWLLTAVLLPLFVFVVFLTSGGTLSVLEASMTDKILVAISGIAYYSIAAGIVEEMVFRGAIMGTLEKAFSTPIAIFIPSVVFGAVHLIGNSLSFGSAIQLMIAGTLVGIMFSLVELESDNFWNNAVIHAVWNMSTIGLFHIGTEKYEYSVFTLIIRSKSNLFTGGDFGVEASVVAIVGYMIVSVVALVLLRKKEKQLV